VHFDSYQVLRSECIQGDTQKFLITSPPGSVRESSLMTMFVCLSVRITQKPHGQTSSIFVHVAWGRGSVLLWQCCDMLCTSGFVDDVMFSHNNPGSFRVLLCGKHYNQITTQIPTKYCSTIKTRSTQCELRTRAKSAVYDCLVNSQGRRQVKYVGWTDMARAEREPITGVWRRSDPPFSPPVKTRRICINFRSDF